MPTPIIVQQDWGAEHPCKNRQASYEISEDAVSANQLTTRA